MRDARADRAGLRVRLAKATTDKERSRCARSSTGPPAASPSASATVAELGQEVSYATVDLSIEGRKRSGARRRQARRPLDARATRSATPAACSRSSPASL